MKRTQLLDVQGVGWRSHHNRCYSICWVRAGWLLDTLWSCWWLLCRCVELGLLWLIQVFIQLCPHVKVTRMLHLRQSRSHRTPKSKSKGGPESVIKTESESGRGTSWAPTPVESWTLTGEATHHPCKQSATSWCSQQQFCQRCTAIASTGTLTTTARPLVLLRPRTPRLKEGWEEQREEPHLEGLVKSRLRNADRLGEARGISQFIIHPIVFLEEESLAGYVLRDH